VVGRTRASRSTVEDRTRDAFLGVRATKDGALLDQGGLLPTASALVRVAGGKVTVVDGPFTEAKEVIGG
jgi:hypothetical protein